MVDKGHKSVSDDTQKSTVVSQRQACCSPIMPMGKIINYLIRFTAFTNLVKVVVPVLQ